MAICFAFFFLSKYEMYMLSNQECILMQSPPEKLVHSRAYHKSKTAAMEAGLSKEDALAKGREAGAAAVAAWVAAGKPDL